MKGFDHTNSSTSAFIFKKNTSKGWNKVFENSSFLSHYNNKTVGVSQIYASMVWRPAFNVHSFTAAIKSHYTASSA
jgi:hypothetical protein